MKRSNLILALTALTGVSDIGAVAPENLQLAVVDGRAQSAFIASTTDKNREQRVAGLTRLLAGARAAQEEPDEAVSGALLVLADIARSETPLAELRKYVDDASGGPETRSLALYALGQVTRRVRGEQALIQMLQPYLQSDVLLIAAAARLSLASTNTPEAVAQLAALLKKHRAALLRVASRGSFDYRWTMEYLRDGEWHSDSETGLLLFPFWRRRKERYLQNYAIRME